MAGNPLHLCLEPSSQQLSNTLKPHASELRPPLAPSPTCIFRSKYTSMLFATDAARWRALTIRDPAANGHFVYSVKSTNCYCRPTCPGRLARRANVGFFHTAKEAEAAGFRACKRCKPDSDIVDDPQERAVTKALNIIDKAVKENTVKAFRLQDLAKHVGLTPRYFHKIFKDKLGMTPKEYTNSMMDNTTSLNSCSSMSPVDTAMLNNGSIDFNNLLGFSLDPGFTSDAAFANGRGHLIPGTEHGIDGQIHSWLGYETFIPNGPEPVTDLAPDSDFFNADATAAASTFELDAALVLSESIPTMVFADAYTHEKTMGGDIKACI